MRFKLVLDKEEYIIILLALIRGTLSTNDYFKTKCNEIWEKLQKNEILEVEAD